MDDPQAKPTRSRIPRFSLRTLLILMSLAGSGGALYAGWGPWRHLCMFTPPCPREAKEVQHTCDFHVIWEWLSKDGGKLLALVNHSYGLDNSPKISTHQILLWDVNTRDVILAKDLASLKAANKISLSAWYPRGANIAVISEDETISILEEITVTVQPGTLVLYAHTMDSWTYCKRSAITIPPSGT